MSSKAAINIVCLGALPILGGIFLYLFLTGFYLKAFLPLLGIIAGMEIRVRMGYRSRTRNWLFTLHLACAGLLIMFLLLLAVLRLNVIVYAEGACLGMVVSGLILITRSWHLRSETTFPL